MCTPLSDHSGACEEVYCQLPSQTSVYFFNLYSVMPGLHVCLEVYGIAVLGLSSCVLASWYMSFSLTLLFGISHVQLLPCLGPKERKEKPKNTNSNEKNKTNGVCPHFHGILLPPSLQVPFPELWLWGLLCDPFSCFTRAICVPSARRDEGPSVGTQLKAATWLSICQ